MSQVQKLVFEIPCDVMVDIAKIILKSGLDHRITGADDEKNTIQMQILIPADKERAKENIGQIIEDYNFFRYGD